MCVVVCEVRVCYVCAGRISVLYEALLLCLVLSGSAECSLVAADPSLVPLAFFGAFLISIFGCRFFDRFLLNFGSIWGSENSSKAMKNRYLTSPKSFSQG